MANPKPGTTGSKTPATPPAPGSKPKKKLVLDVNDVQSVLERKISP